MGTQKKLPSRSLRAVGLCGQFIMGEAAVLKGTTRCPQRDGHSHLAAGALRPVSWEGS